jgi:hypothetical protein
MEFPDSHNDQFLKHLKNELDAFKTQAPKELWEGIAHELDHGSDVIDDSLKIAAASVNNTAPSFLWSNIEASISNEPASASTDELIDHKLKEAAENLRQAPEYIWYGIEQQLNIDKIWNGMQPRLDKIRSNYLWKKRLSFVGAAAFLLLLIRGCGVDLWLPETAKPVFTENTKAVENSFFNAKKSTKELKDTHYINGVGPNNLKPDEINGNFQTNLPKLNTVKRNSFPIIQKITEIKQSVLPDFQQSHLINNSTGTVVQALPDSIFKNELADEHKLVLSSIEKRKIRLIESFDIKIKDMMLPVSNLKSQFKNPFKTSYEIGLIGVLNSAILINDQNTKKLNRVRADNVKAYSNLSFSYGLQVSVKFAKRHSLITEFWFDSKIKQEYRYMVSGRLHTDQAELNYVKVNLYYRPVLFSYGNNSIVALAGAYLSNLKNISYSSSGHANYSPAAASLWDTGIGLGIGQEHRIGKSLVLDYGLRNEIGVSSIFQTNRYTPVKTNLLGFGAYLAMRYRF